MNDFKILLSAELSASTEVELNSKIKKISQSIDGIDLKINKKSISDLEKQIEIFKKLQLSRLVNIDTNDAKRVADLSKRISDLGKNTLNAKYEMRDISADITILGRESRKTSSELSTFAKFFGMNELINATKQAIDSVTQSVLDLDAAILEVQKVAEIPNMDNFISQAYDAADSIKILGTDFIDGVAEFSRQGKDLEDAFDLSTVANKMVVVGDGIKDVADASGVLTSALSIFEKKGYTAQDVLDQINQISNRTSSSFSDLADIVRRSSATLGLSGANLEQVLALGTALNETLRNSEMVGTSLNAINQKLMGLDDQGTYSVELVAKMGDELKKLANVDVMDDNTGQLRSTFEILQDISGAWVDIDKNTQLAIASSIGNIRHSKSVIALMENWDTVNKSLEESTRAQGSSQIELQAYLDSTTGKVNAMKGALQEMYVSSISSEFVGSVAEISTGVIKLVQSVGGLGTVIAGLTVALATLKLSDMAGGVSALTKQIMTLTFNTEICTAATTALGIAQTLLVGAGIVAGVMAIGGAIKYVSESSERAEAKVVALKSELNDMKSSSKSFNQLSKDYEVLATNQRRTNEENERFRDIQNELKQILPSLNGYYDEQNNFIISQSENMDELIKKNAEDIRQKKEQLLLANNKIYKKDTVTNDGFKEDIAMAKEFIRLQELSANGTTMSNEDIEKLHFLSIEYGNIENAQRRISDAQKYLNDNLGSTRERLGLIVETSGLWNTATEEQRNNVKKLISEMSFNALENGMKLADQDANRFLERLILVTTEFDKQDDVLGSGSGAEKQRKSIEQLQDEFKKLQDTYSDTTSAMKDLKSIQEEYDKYGKISQSSMNSIVSKYPELLSAMGDEGKFREMLIERIGEQKSAQETALTEITLLQNQYAQDIKQIDSQLYEELLQYYQTYSENYADAMEGSVEAWGKMSQAQADITTKLIDNLGIAWKSYFSAIAQGFDALGSSISVISDNKITHQSDFTEEQWNSLSGIEKQQIENMKETVRTTTEAGKQFSAIGEALSNVMSSFDSGGIEISIPVETSLDDKKSGSKKDDTAKDIKDKLQAELDKIQKPRIELDYEIDILNAKLDTATLKNDQKSIEIINNQLADLLNKRKELTATQNVELGSLKTKFTDSTSISTITSLMSDNSKEWWKDLNNAIQQNINIINMQKDIIDKQVSKYDTDIQQQQSKLSILQLQNGAVNEQVDLYKSLSTSYLEQQYYIEKTLQDMYNQRSTLKESSKEYELITQNILDFESKLVNVYKSQADVKKDLIDLAHEQMEIELEKAIYGSGGKDEWKKDNDDKIKALQDELDLIESQAAAKKKKEEAEKRELELQQLKDKLANLRNQKTEQEYRKQADGSYQWEYVADKQAIADVEKEIADKQVEIEKAAEEQKLEDKKQSIKDQISQLQNLEKAKEESYTRSLEDLKLAMENEKFAWTLNGEEVSGIVENALTNVSGIYDVKMSDILSNVQSKLDSIRDAFDSAMNMANNMPSGGSGSSGGGSSNTVTGATGKEYEIGSDGTITVSRPDGTTSTVKPSDSNYDKTNSAMMDDLKNKKFASGGETSSTGWHWLDGDVGSPERVLSAEQTEAFEIGMKNIPRFNETMKTLFDLATPQVSRLKTPTSNPTASSISFGDINLPNVKDARGFANEVREVVSDMFSGISNQAKLKPVN